MRQLTTTNYTNSTNWRRSWRLLLLLAIFNCQLSIVNSVRAQDAFYIYQNDGHFDGFFYDEVQKISYSFLDTLGIEHDKIVSQEIVTPDSTYRIMLSAIDSVGFVQPEVKYAPRVRKLHLATTYSNAYYYDEHNHLIHYFSNVCTIGVDKREIPTEYLPQVGDVFLYPGAEDGWAIKVVSLEGNDYWLTARCEPVTDINDIFQQFITVEEYGYDDEGNLTRRRVAGQPDLTVGKFTRRASSGAIGGDFFNFSINGHLPIYTTDDLNITVDPSIEGKLHLKTVWDLSWFGDKYIGITSKLKFGVGMGFTVDGKIKDFFPSGIGNLGSIPVPATCPLLIIDCGPDAFLRGEAHVNFKMSTPKLNGAMWAKLELQNWKPSIDIGFGNSDDGSKFESVDNSGSRVSMSLNGFIQTGMLFPMKFKSLPILKKICDVEVGGQWFVGPKVSGDFTLDLTTMPWDDVATYNQLKNITLGVHLMDADFEVKAKAETLAGVSDVTLADGSIGILPNIDAKLVPEFGDCVEYEDERLIFGEIRKCRVFAFEPQGNVVSPIQIGTYAWDVGRPDGCLQETPFFNVSGLLGQELPKRLWAEYVLPYNPHNTNPTQSGKIKVQPAVIFFGHSYLANPVYETYHGAYIKETSGDTLVLNYDWSPRKSIWIYSNCDSVVVGSTHKHGHNLDFLTVTGSNGTFEVSVDQALNHNPPNYSRVDTLFYEIGYYSGYATINDELFGIGRNFHVWVMPNETVDPIKFRLSNGFDLPWEQYSWNPGNEPLNYEITRTDDGKGWHIKAYYHEEKDLESIHFDMEFDYVLAGEGSLSSGYKKFLRRNGHFSASRQSRKYNGDIETALSVSCDHFDELESYECIATGRYKRYYSDTYEDITKKIQLDYNIVIEFPPISVANHE